MPFTQVPAHVRPCMRWPSFAGLGSTAANTSRGATCASPTRIFSTLSRPRYAKVFSQSMNSAPREYLNVTRLHSISRGMSSTSSCSTFTHSYAPMPAGKWNTSGSLKHSVVKRPRDFSHTIGGFKHSSMVVQMENVGANSKPSIDRFEPSRTPISSMLSKR